MKLKIVFDGWCSSLQLLADRTLEFPKAKGLVIFPQQVRFMRFKRPQKKRQSFLKREYTYPLSHLVKME